MTKWKKNGDKNANPPYVGTDISPDVLISFFFGCNQALSYLSGHSKTELPLVVERETIKEDGTVVRRCVSAESHGVTACVLCNNFHSRQFAN